MDLIFQNNYESQEIEDEESLYPQFEELPIEVQATLLSENPEYTISANKTKYKEIMAYDFYQNFCNKTINIEEIMDYLNTKPNNFSIFYTYQDIDPLYRQNIINNDKGILDGLFGNIFYKIGRRQRNINYVEGTSVLLIEQINRKNIKYIPLETELSNLNIETLDGIKELIQNLKNVQFDFKTLKILLLRRGKCSSINPSYIQETLLSTFRDYIKQNNINDLTRQLELNLYLRQNAEMLDIDISKIKVINYEFNDEDFSDYLKNKISKENNDLILIINRYLLTSNFDE